MSEAPQGFRRTVVLKRFLPGTSSRDPGLTNCPPNRGKSVWPLVCCWRAAADDG